MWRRQCLWPDACCSMYAGLSFEPSKERTAIVATPPVPHPRQGGGVPSIACLTNASSARIKNIKVQRHAPECVRAYAIPLAETHGRHSKLSVPLTQGRASLKDQKAYAFCN